MKANNVFALGWSENVTIYAAYWADSMLTKSWL